LHSNNLSWFAGVYRRSPDLNTFIDVNSVEELRAHSISYNLELGGGVTLTETMDILETVCKKPGYEYTSEILKHIDWIGNVPVRNVGTIAGNLMIKNNHREFASDLVTIFAAVGAKVVIRKYKPPFFVWKFLTFDFSNFS
jgi:xanthine dehydrogenase/oxidase